MTERELILPIDEPTVRSLRCGDMVRLSGEIHMSAGLPTHARLLGCLDGVEPLPFDFRGGALFHLGSLNEETPSGLHIHYMNPTTSTRFNPHMPRLIEGLGLRLTGGKGGLDARSAAAMARAGCVYLAFLGGGAPLLTDAIRKVTAIGWPELIEHYRIVRLEVDRLGPLTVAIDATGASLYGDGETQAADRRDGILARMKVARDAGA